MAWCIVCLFLIIFGYSIHLGEVIISDISTFLGKRQISFKLICKTWEEYVFTLVVFMVLRVPLVLTVPAKFPQRFPPTLDRPQGSVPAQHGSISPCPAILHGCWSPALFKELLCCFVHAALSAVSECMHPGLYGTGGWENPLAWAMGNSGSRGAGKNNPMSPKTTVFSSL